MFDPGCRQNEEHRHHEDTHPPAGSRGDGYGSPANNNFTIETMTNNISTDEQAALELLLGGETVTTPATLSAGLRWLLSKVRHELASRPSPGEQVYLTTGGVAKRYGVSKCQAIAWMGRLRELNKVRIQVPISGKNDKGDTMYYLPDIEAAFEENARRITAAQKN